MCYLFVRFISPQRVASVFRRQTSLAAKRASNYPLLFPDKEMKYPIYWICLLYTVAALRDSTVTSRALWAAHCSLLTCEYLRDSRQTCRSEPGYCYGWQRDPGPGLQTHNNTVQDSTPWLTYLWNGRRRYRYMPDKPTTAIGLSAKPKGSICLLVK